MKKLFALLLAMASLSAGFAQSSTTEKAKRVIRGERRDYDPNRSADEDARDVIAGRDRRTVYNDRDYRTGSRSREEQVNRDYDAKVRSIRNNPTLSRSEKERIIRGLEAERQRRLTELRGNSDRRYAERSRDNGRYGRDRDDDDDDRNRKFKHKHNNGRRLGWQKGKGNPHRD